MSIPSWMDPSISRKRGASMYSIECWIQGEWHLVTVRIEDLKDALDSLGSLATLYRSRLLCEGKEIVYQG